MSNAPADGTRPPDPTPRDELGARLQALLPGLLAFIRLRAGRTVLAKDSAADLAQSACREILEDRERADDQPEAGLRRGLYLAAERKIVDRARRWGSKKRDASLETRPARPSEILSVYRSFCSPSRAAAAREELARVEAAFARLPEADQLLILQARVIGLTHAEIAGQLGCTEGAVRTQLSRALARLAVLLD